MIKFARKIIYLEIFKPTDVPLIHPVKRYNVILFIKKIIGKYDPKISYSNKMLEIRKNKINLKN